MRPIDATVASLRTQVREAKEANEALLAQLAEVTRERDRLIAERDYEAAKVELTWSDRGGLVHPSQFWESVHACALDHHYDRTADGVPHGIPQKYREAFAEVVADHLSRSEPNWRNQTVYMSQERAQAFEDELKAVNAAILEPNP